MRSHTLTSLAIMALLSSGGIALAQNSSPSTGAMGQPKTMDKTMDQTHQPSMKPSEKTPGTAGSTTHSTTNSAAVGTTASIGDVDVMQVEGGTALSKVMGNNVYNGQGDKVGSLEDVVVVPGQQKLYGIISVGGFLGIGEHLVAVPYDSLQHGGDGKIVLAGATKEELKAAPEFKYKEKTTIAPSRSTLPSTK